MSIHSRARGAVLGHMVGDAIGAAFEGFSRDEIRSLCRSLWGTPFVEDFVLAVPMGTFVPGPDPGTYREAREDDDWNFVPSGPSSDNEVRRQCARFGCYTDDTASCLAIGSSIVDCSAVESSHAARRCAEFFRDNERHRGCPPTAKRIMRAALEGVPVTKIGLPPYFPFAGGSFANGGAMRISLLPIAFRNADDVVLRRSVKAAIMGSHRHPEAIDFAVVQAAAVQFALHTLSPATFEPLEFLSNVAQHCQTKVMQQMVQAVRNAFVEILAKNGCGCDEDFQIVCRLIEREERPGSSRSFQIASVHMMPCVLWCVLRHYQDPLRAVQAAIDLGGDTDTTAAMVGAMVGALHGEDWCPVWALSLENGPHGRDYALRLAEQLADLDLRN